MVLNKKIFDQTRLMLDPLNWKSRGRTLGKIFRLYLMYLSSKSIKYFLYYRNSYQGQGLIVNVTNRQALKSLFS